MAAAIALLHICVKFNKQAALCGVWRLCSVVQVREADIRAVDAPKTVRHDLPWYPHHLSCRIRHTYLSNFITISCDLMDHSLQITFIACEKNYLSGDKNILVEIRSWRDRNLKFGPNCDLEVD